MKKRLIPLLLVVAMVFSMAITASAAELPAAGTDLKGTVAIIHVNDSHGRIAEDAGSGQAGLATVSAVKKAYDAAGATVLLLDAGDTLHGLPIATINRGADVVTVMNAMEYDLMVPGNHDFNYGTERLVELAATMKFPVIAANVEYNANKQLVFDAYKVIEKDGVKFGIFGLATPETAYKTNPNNVASVTFTDPTEAARKAVTDLQAAGVDYVIALGHIGVDFSSEDRADLIAAAVDGIDIFIDGHSHTAMIDGKPVDTSIRLADHGDTVIASTGEYINNIGVVTIDAEGAIKADLIPYSESLPSDDAVVSLIAGVQTQQDTILAEVVGSTSVLLDGARETNRKEETNLGNLAADAFRAATKADVAFTNGGGIRDSIQIGDITKKDLVTVFPFGNYVVTKEVTGAAILAAMEHGVKDYPELSGGFPQVSGIEFKFDESKPAGSRIYEASVGGTALDPAATYLLATNDFIAAGGDDYTMLGSFPIVNEFEAMEEILISYIQSSETVTAAVEGRITTGEAPAAEVEAPVVAEPEPVPAIQEPTPVAEPEAPVAAASSADLHIVEKGDNLWKIAEKYTGSGTNWTQIYELNKDTIKNPDRIQIGQEIRLKAS